MKIRCNLCGEPVVSADVPDKTVVRAWIECAECIEKQPDTTNLPQQAGLEFFCEKCTYRESDACPVMKNISSWSKYDYCSKFKKEIGDS